MIGTAFLYTSEYDRFDYGPRHPLRISRLRLTHQLMDAYGLLDLENCAYLATRSAKLEELLVFHAKDYLTVLENAGCGRMSDDLYLYGIGPGDNPAFSGMLEWSLLTAGATLQCAEVLAKEEVRIAFNVAGGLHHAAPRMASGFCYANDPVLGILALKQKGRRVAYIDVDAHHGDGVQNAFYSDPDVLTISFHQDGATLFPGSGPVTDIGRDEGRGFSINVPFLPHADDAVFTKAFKKVVPEAIELFDPDVIVAQLGVDSFRTDPLASLDLTTNGFCEAVGMIVDLKRPLLALGGGGYETSNVARAWTLAWAIMNDIELPEDLPDSLRPAFECIGYHKRSLRDARYTGCGRANEEAHRRADETVAWIEEHVFPLIREKVPSPRSRRGGSD
ncbi:MAG: acetoin utilization protein AcuC [Deltaproteobacteria bacterium]|nr:acetoin utilization protein AcuC [Deltaproteobacteria bacterium]